MMTKQSMRKYELEQSHMETKTEISTC